MDIQLQELLEKIKRDGVESARAEAARIVAEGEAAKRARVEEASREAKAIVEKAKAEAARAEESGRAALAQASRDLLLAFRGSLEGILAKAVSSETKAAYGPEVLAEAIPAAVKALAAGGSESGLAVLLPPQELRKLEGRFAGLLSEELKKGVELKPYADLDAGFRIAERGGAAYYDFSAEALAELFAKHLNARLAETLRSAAKGM